MEGIKPRGPGTEAHARNLRNDYCGSTENPVFWGVL